MAADLAADAAGPGRHRPADPRGTVGAAAGSQTWRRPGEQPQPPGLLAADARGAYRDAAARILDATQDGALLRGEVLARWQDFVGTGEFFRVAGAEHRPLAGPHGAFFRGEPAPAVTVETAIETGLQAVIVDEAANAAEDADRRWRADPAGRQLLGADDPPGTSAGFADRRPPRSAPGRGT